MTAIVAEEKDFTFLLRELAAGGIASAVASTALNACDVTK